MRAVAALVDTVVAVTPFAFVAVVTFPVAGVCERFADVTEDTSFLPLLRVVLAHECMWRGGRFNKLCERPSIPLPGEHMRMLTVGWIAALGCVALVAKPGCPAKSKPMLAAFAVAEAAQTNGVIAALASLAVVMQLVLDMILAA